MSHAQSHLQSGSRDYDRIASAIEYLVEHAVDQPDLARLSRHVGLSPHHLQRVFTRWAGVSPKQFLGFVTQQKARALLRGQSNLLDTSLDVGLSGPGRLHDLCVTWEAMTPGEIKSGGEALDLSFGFHDSPFGCALLLVAPRGLSALAFCDDDDKEAALSDLKGRWPRAHYDESPELTRPYAENIFRNETGEINLVMKGTPFQIKVWEALLRIPVGQTVSYSDIAIHIGNPRAVRAIGQAVGRNPIAYVIPCHRVLQSTGALGGYHWGRTRKQALLAYEQARAVNAS